MISDIIRFYSSDINRFYLLSGMGLTLSGESFCDGGLAILSKSIDNISFVNCKYCNYMK